MEWQFSWLLTLTALLSFALSFIGAAVGLVLGQLRPPLLIAYLGSAPAGAAANLIISAAGGLAGTYRHVRDGRVSWHCLALMGTPSVVGAAVAAYLFSRHVDYFWSYLAIGAMLVVSGLQLLRPPPAPGAGAELPRGTRLLLEVLIGLALGGLAAVTGLMLGSLRLPMMMRLLKIDPKVAAGSNMAIGCVTGLIGAASAFLSLRETIHWDAIGTVLLVVVPTMLGSYLGGWLTGYISKDRVRQLAGWVIVFTGLMMVGQGAWPVVSREPARVPALLAEDDEPWDWDFDMEDD